MFCRTGHNMVLFLLIEMSYPFDGQVIGFGGTACKNDLSRVGIDDFCNMSARRLNGLLSPPSIGMATRMRIAKFFRKIRQHGF